MSDPTPILVVEDNEDDAFLLERAGKQAGVNSFRFVSDGRQAIDYLKGNGPFSDRGRFPMPFLILLDLKLPFVSGFDVLKWIRQQPEFCTLVVIVLTSSKERRDIRRAAELGASSYLTKPATTGELVELIRAIKEYWLHMHQFPPQPRSA